MLHSHFVESKVSNLLAVKPACVPPDMLGCERRNATYCYLPDTGTAASCYPEQAFALPAVWQQHWIREGF